MPRKVDKAINKMTIEQIREIINKQRELENKERDRLRDNMAPKMLEYMKPGSIPAMPKYGGTPREEQKTPEELKREALIHLQNRQESKALGEAKRRADEEFESGYKKRN